MDQVVIDKLAGAYGPVKWYKKSILGFKKEEWFVLETIPLPPKEELSFVISDIVNSLMIDFNDGKVRHYHGCQNINHNIPKFIKGILPDLEEQKFRVAICTGSDDFLMGQPIAIALEPKINYMLYPDHPHLNSGGLYKGVYIPDSFCYGYTVSPEIYGPTEYNRYINAFDEITLWLLRHQVWEAVKQKTGKGKWIGPHEGQLPPEAFASTLNPFGKCRCGKQQTYIHCHLPHDIEAIAIKKSREFELPKRDVKQNIIKKLVHAWNPSIGIPHTNMLQKLNLILT